MSTSEKLTYLNGTKQALKESINNLGGDITNETTFREYAQELDNIYDNLPKTSYAEGSNITLSNTLKGKLDFEDGIVGYGDTQQTQYSGYNLLPTTISQSTYNGITIQRQSDGSYKVTGTATGNAILYILNESDNITLPSGSYYISGCPSGGVAETYRLVISVGGTLYGEYGSGRAITTSSSGTLSAYIYIGTGTTINLTYYPMLVSGSTAKPYEPYVGGIASPNPTFPQNIEVVTGEQEVKVENVNLANETNIQIGKAWNEASNNARAIWQIPILPNTTYTISYTDKSGLDGLFRYQKTNYNDSSASVGVAEITTSPTTFTSASNSYWLGLQFNKSSVTLADIQAVKIQVEKGSTATTYTPHQEQTQTISLGDIELCKIGNYHDYLYKTSGKNKLSLNEIKNISGTTSLGITRNISNEIISLNGTSNGSGQIIPNTNLKVTLPKGTYTYSVTMYGTATRGTGQDMAMLIRSSSSNISNRTLSQVQNGNNSETFTLSQDTEIYIQFYINASGIVFNNCSFAIMINEGSTALPYEPYGSGKWYKKEILYKIANKTNWSVDNVASNNRAVISLSGNGFPYSSDIGYATANAISNNFVGISQLNQASTTSINNIAINNANMYIKFADTINTTALVKTQLDSMTSLEIYYVVATPQDIEITDTNLITQLDNLEKMKSYNGVTNISSSGNLPIVLGVSAIKGES